MTNKELEAAFHSMREGQLDIAAKAFSKWMHDPSVGADARRGLASVAWRRRQPDTAVQLLQEALRLTPDHADAIADLALVYMLAGRSEASANMWGRRVELCPNDAPAWHNFGKALVESKRYSDAIVAFERALELDPSQAGTYVTFAKCMSQIGDVVRAERLWHRALAVDPKTVAAYQGLGELLFHLGRYDDCLDNYRHGATVLPESPDLRMAFGQMLEDFGDKDGAEREFRRAIDLRPGWVFPVEALLTLIRGNASDYDLDLARAVLAEENRPPNERAMAAFGLGKALDSKGDIEGAFDAWDLANASRREQVGPFKRQPFEEKVDRICGVFSSEFFAERPGWGSADPRPVFVVGMPRSGTSLVEQILAAHPDAYGYGELTDVSQIAGNLPDGAGTLHRWPEAAEVVSSGLIAIAADRYLSSQQARERTTASRLVDKAPLNFLHLGLIRLLFPAAHIIWCRRDPRDVCVSIYAENFGLGQRHATDLGDLGFYYKQHIKLMSHWEAVLPGSIITVEYESLIMEPEEQSRRLVEAIGLPWNANCLKFYEHERPVLTPSRWQVRSPIYRGAVARWRRYESRLAPLLNELGAEAGQ
mgnify:CR=1 FL=1